ncbi:MAG TPA: FG-GAP-like repeat-containing protein, partial [Solirubrobacterales bacterium]|nr:FG-GAP-like repeat-containing protein [Solirubrobacterales bacterium]
MELLEPFVPAEPQEMAENVRNRRIFAADQDCDPSDSRRVNLRLDIDCRDDRRVDVDVAVLDNGVDVEADLDVVARTDCTLDTEGPFGCVDDTGYDAQEPNGSPGPGAFDGNGHGTNIAEKIGELDNGRGRAGIASGARIWSVKVTALAGGVADSGIGLSQVIAGVDWVDAHADQIEVVNMSLGCNLPWTGPPGENPFPGQVECSNWDVLDEAISAAIDDGVVFAVAAGNSGIETSLKSPQSNSDVINTSLVSDFDGLPGGQYGEAIHCPFFGDPEDLDHDDTSASFSSNGQNVDIAAPGPCGGTSGAAPQAAAAAAILASRGNPEDHADVMAIRHTIEQQGNLEYVENSGDGIQEPLLDVSCEGVFDPATVPGEEEEGGAQAGPLAPTESDVSRDCRSDLIGISSSGAAEVFAGTASSFDISEPTSSLSLDPALLDDEGEHMVDAADVTGDGRADLVSIGTDGSIYVRPGAEDHSFGTAKSSLGPFVKLTWNGGAYEPIAIDDVTGDGHADLLAGFISQSGNQLIMAPGHADGSFGGLGNGLSASLVGEVDSALLDGEGDYFLDAGDIDGDGKPDLVSLNTSGTAYVFKGKGDGTFSSGTAAASLNPIMDDGEGSEPVGLGDVDGDQRADLLALQGGTLKLYAGLQDGTFDEPT